MRISWFNGIARRHKSARTYLEGDTMNPVLFCSHRRSTSGSVSGPAPPGHYSTACRGECRENDDFRNFSFLLGRSSRELSSCRSQKLGKARFGELNVFQKSTRRNRKFLLVGAENDVRWRWGKKRRNVQARSLNPPSVPWPYSLLFLKDIAKGIGIELRRISIDKTRFMRCVLCLQISRKYSPGELHFGKQDWLRFSNCNGIPLIFK